MQRAATKANDKEIPEMELGGEFPVEDIVSGEGGLLQVCMEGIGVLFADRKVQNKPILIQNYNIPIFFMYCMYSKTMKFLFQIFVRLENIRKCYTQKKGIFVLEEFSKQININKRKLA